MGRILPARLTIIVALVAVVLGWQRGMVLYTDYLWFRSLGFQQVLLVGWTTQVLTGLAAALLAFCVVYLNVLAARRIAPLQAPSASAYARFPPFMLNLFSLAQGLTRLALPVAIALSAIAGYQASTQWREFLIALKAENVAPADPLFHQSASFYLFRYPFYCWTVNAALVLLGVTAALVAVVYLVSAAMSWTNRDAGRPPRWQAHFILLLNGLLLLIALHYRLKSFGLLFTAKSIFHGAGFTEARVLLPTLNVAIILSLAAIPLLLMQLSASGRLRALASKPLILCIAGLLVLPPLGNAIIVPLIQKFLVSPNEIAYERGYINNNIQATLTAFDLGNVERQSYAVSHNLTAEDLAKHSPALASARLWDHRPLRETYQQLQEIRPYYRFTGVDLDRYRIRGHIRQVALSPRELDTTALPTSAQNWINLHLKYTHGYGLCLSPVNATTPEGLPLLWVKNIPPVSEVDLEIRRPEIYFGEAPLPYVFTNTRQPEFDYPSGDKNTTCVYRARNGIPIGSMFRRAAFTARFNDWKILLSKDVTADTQILMRRNIYERVKMLAPFLSYDSDPYLVIADGNLYWIMDAYTTSRLYPYSTPVVPGGANYLRNAVKVVINAYDGQTRFYLYRTDDPIVKTYSRIFPSLFTDMKEMPPELEEHLRYPLDLLKVQSEVYATYHMSDAESFYAKEDAWRIGHEVIESRGNEQPMEPYYMIMRLPDEGDTIGKSQTTTPTPKSAIGNQTSGDEEFVLMAPFTPQRRQNMIAWLCARCDAPNRGKLRVYQLTKGQTVEGPMQIEALIDQDTEISKLMTLWGELGSSVIRGNLILLPLENSLLYVKPIYLKASATPLPELKQVIVACNQRVAMAESFPKALTALFGTSIGMPDLPTTAGGATSLSEDVTGSAIDIHSLTQQGLEQYRQAEQSLQAGDWQAFGDAMQRLQRTLNRMRQGTESKPKTGNHTDNGGTH